MSDTRNKNYHCFPTVPNVELKPCPFCGAEAELDIDYSPDTRFPPRYLAGCSECCGMIEVWWDTREEAAEAWNRRAQE